MNLPRTGTLALGWIAALSSSLLSCGDRRESFEAFPGLEVASTAVGLDEAVALLDAPLDRVMVLQGDRFGQLETTAVRVGRNPYHIQSDVTGDRLLVLSRGVQPRLRASDELPSLTLVGAKGLPGVIDSYALNEQYRDITLDPEGQWAVLAGSAAGDSVVSNPNQLVLIDMQQEGFEPVSKTIRSFGAAPERFFFTEPLDVPGGETRFLVVETRQDVHLIDLEDLEAAEITIGLPRSAGGEPRRPLEVVVHPGDEGAVADARFAIRLENDTSLMLLSFAARGADQPGPSYSLTPNLVDVGGVSSAIDFVQTDDGVRLASLVPSRQQAVLIDPQTTRIETLSLPGRFDKMRPVSPSDANQAEGDMALLWGESTTQVAFWSLGRTADRAFRSIDVLDLAASVQSVIDVPGRSLSHIKLVQAYDSRFFVLDLRSRQSFPMLGNGEQEIDLSVSPEGNRAWAYSEGSNGLAHIDLTTLRPTSLRLERPVQRVFDIGVGFADTQVVIALHSGGGLGATVMNADDPDTANTRFYPGLLLGGLL